MNDLQAPDQRPHGDDEDSSVGDDECDVDHDYVEINDACVVLGRFPNDEQAEQPAAPVPPALPARDYYKSSAARERGERARECDRIKVSCGAEPNASRCRSSTQERRELLFCSSSSSSEAVSLTTRRQGFEAVRTSGAFTAVLVHVDYDE
jgi:hypothetical protein